MSFLLSGFYFAVQAGGDFLIDFIIQYVPHLLSRCPTSRLGCHPTDPTPLPLVLARIFSDPHDKALLEEIGTSQGDFILTANTVGEYSFCFENEASLTDKMIDFEYVPLCFSPSICLVERQHLPRRTAASDQLAFSPLDTAFDSIMVESEPRRELPGKQLPISTHTTSLEESIYKLNGLLSSIVRTQK